MNAEVLASAALEHLPCGVMVASADRVLLCNTYAARLLDVDPDVLLQRSIDQCFAPSQRARVQQLARSLLALGTMSEPLELVAQRGDGSTVIVDVRMTRVMHAGRRTVLMTVTDAWERLRSTGSLARLAFEDTVTGLPNRASFIDSLNKTLLRGKRRGDGFALGLLDVDGFKRVNDDAGHDVGDVVLREIGGRLRAAVRESDVVARLGGDEFTLLLPGILDSASAMKVGNSIHRALQPPIAVGPHTFTLGASLGLAIFPHHGQDMQALLVAADSAMYEGKRRGKGASLVFDGVAQGTHHHLDRALEWGPQLETGVPSLDLEHRGLADALNSLLEALSSAETDSVVGARLAQALELATQHFTNEEAAMRNAGFDGHAQHAAQHRLLLRELGSIGETFEDRGLSQSIQLVRDWFLGHLIEDKVFAGSVLQAR